MGFNSEVIAMIKLFCADNKSSLQINGHVLDQFDIGRGIRQGCPLSMILYVLFKESLYTYIKSCIGIKGIPLPNENELKISGYADDTNLFTIDNESIVNIFNVLNQFEAATGASLNKSKTKIYGIGTWKNKIDWPIPWLNTSVDSFKSLGITFSNDYQLAVTTNWENIMQSIEIKVRIMQNVKLTMYQKATMINCIRNAKLYLLFYQVIK